MWRSVVELTPIKHICIGYLAPAAAVRIVVVVVGGKIFNGALHFVAGQAAVVAGAGACKGVAILAAIAVRHRMREPPILFTGRHQGASGRRVSMGVNSTNGDLVAVAGRTSATKRVTAVVHHLAGLDGEEGKKRCE